ncbi:shematrin-like protein 1 isoform X2 [Wyeomyia smithii]|uniref:shematrin-like protein 1 isoform X2 n=1 Tax=Wyeomyia smithii TaxID=174621 RepID=UPI002467BE8B|nr:shematrin-like protein 1 isoform X2 [Wyeomyia smithii]
MKLVLLVVLLVLGIVNAASTDDEDVAGPKSTEAAEERIFDLSRKSRQLLGSALGYSPYGFNQGYGMGNPYSGYSGYSGYPGIGGYPYGGNGNGLSGYGLYGNGLYSGGLANPGFGSLGLSPFNVRFHRGDFFPERPTIDDPSDDDELFK